MDRDDPDEDYIPCDAKQTLKYEAVVGHEGLFNGLSSYSPIKRPFI